MTASPAHLETVALVAAAGDAVAPPRGPTQMFDPEHGQLPSSYEKPALRERRGAYEHRLDERNDRLFARRVSALE